MSYPKTGQEVYVSLNLSNTMLTGIGKGTITREEVSVDYLKRLFAEHGVIVSAKPEQHRLLEIVNATFDLGLELPEDLKLFQLSASKTAAGRSAAAWRRCCCGHTPAPAAEASPAAPGPVRPIRQSLPSLRPPDPQERRAEEVAAPVCSSLHRP